MSDELYAILAMAARYWFCGLMILIVARAWRGAAVDRARARTIRLCAPQTGCVGTFTVYPGTKREAAIPIPREGEIGRARRADIRVRERALKPYHAHFEIREDGLLIAPHPGADARLNSRVRGDALLMRDGDTLSVCGVRMKLALYERSPAREPETWDEDTLWDTASVAHGDSEDKREGGYQTIEETREAFEQARSKFLSPEAFLEAFTKPDEDSASQRPAKHERPRRAARSDDWDDDKIWAEQNPGRRAGDKSDDWDDESIWTKRKPTRRR